MKVIRKKLHLSKGERTDIFCNRCGVSCLLVSHGDDEEDYFGGLIEVSAIGGYASTHLVDGDVYEFSLCERCLLEVVKDFTFSARRGNYLHPDNYASGFDRRKYVGDGVKFWDEFTEEEKEEMRNWLLDPAEEEKIIREAPRQELIVWLFELEEKEKPDEEDKARIQQIRRILKERRPTTKLNKV